MKKKYTTSLERLKWHITLREAQTSSDTCHTHQFVPLASLTSPVLSINSKNVWKFLHYHLKRNIYHHLQYDCKMYSVCATVHMCKHHNFFFLCQISVLPFLVVFSLVPFKIKLRNAHGLQRREAGGPLKSSPPVQAGSLKKGPWKGNGSGRASSQ